MKKKSLINSLGGQKVIVLLVVIILFAFFCTVSQSFRQVTTFIDILSKSYYWIFMAIGVTFPLITGGVDLSIGTGLICYSLAGGYLIVQKGCPTAVGILIALLFGIIIGTANGFLIAVMDLPAFLATLCTCMITRGLGSLCSKSMGICWPQLGTPGGWFRAIFKVVSPTKVQYPIGIIWAFIIVLLMEFVLNHTKIGRYTFAIGSNKEAAILSGINVKFYHIMAYVLSGFFAALASVAYSAVFTTVQPGTGAGFELEAIGGAIIGGVSATGGAGSILGSFIGVFVICLLKTGLPFIGLQANWQQIITGIVLIAAVLVDIIKRKREAKI